MDDDLKRNAKDKVFKDLLQNRDNLIQFYYDLTGIKVNPKEIDYETIATSLVKGHEEDVAFQIGSKFIILFEAQSSWNYKKDIVRFATYMFILFTNFIEKYQDELFDQYSEITIPAVEAYIIYTGSLILPETVSLDECYSYNQESMINAKMKLVSYRNAVGMVKEYIEFSNLETDFYKNNKRSKKDIMELIDYCIKHNILKKYFITKRNEVETMIENFFTEERRIEGLINSAVYNAVNKERQKSKKELEKVQAQNKLKIQNEINNAVKEERQKSKRELDNNRKNEIGHLLKLDIPIEKIIEITGYPIELINEVLTENQIVK